jgi:UDP-4-amino-4-deoxy-L-arabinose formyltransferase/UDP-glucuronic acid dehydrogenase (UDP-4-keto-hexauronic acid decarboxylating)
MKNKKIIIIGGRQISVECLKELLRRGLKPRLVIGNLGDRGQDGWHQSLIKFAKKQKLPTLVGKQISQPNVIKKIKDISPEIIFCLGATQIIPPEILKIPKLGCLNIHPALLPKYRGRYSTAHAIFNGEKYAGVTAHWLNEKMDAGPIIFQRRIAIAPDDTAKSLYDKVLTHGGLILFKKFLALWLSGRPIPSRPQNEKVATSFSKEMPNKGELDWAWTGRKIFNFIRAMTFEPFPPAEFRLGKKQMVIIDKKYFKGFN